MKIDLMGINLQRNLGWNRHLTIMCFADIGLDDIETTLRAVALARHNGEIIVLPPKVPGAKLGDLGGIQWNTRGKFAQAIRDVILAGYEKMGGEMPPEPTVKQQTGINAARRFVEKAKPAVHRDHVTGKRIGEDPFDAKVAPIERRVVPAVFSVHEAANDNDVSGVLRTLGIEVEEAERACG